MRQLCVRYCVAPSIEHALEEFNERASEFGIDSEEQVVSVSVTPYTGTVESLTPGGKTEKNTVVLAIWYWPKD